jgi:hypothetical protein
VLAGVTLATSGARSGFCSAETSASIRSLGAVPPGTFPTVGTIVMRLASGSTYSLTADCTPLPMATSRITAATPMTMPSMVSAERNRLARNPRRVRTASRRLIIF